MTDPARMTVAEARQRYSFTADPIGYHHQPVCQCGDYILHHEQAPPHRCGFSRNPSQCRCFSYRFARMGPGPREEDRARWLAQGCPDWPDRGAMETAP